MKLKLLKYATAICIVFVIGLNVYTYYDLKHFRKSIDYKPINSRDVGGQQYQGSNPVSRERQTERQEGVFHDQHTLADRQKSDDVSIEDVADLETQPESISENGQEPETESLFSKEMTDEEKVVAFKKWMTDFNRRLESKYPEITEYPYLTNQEFEELYPTPEDKARFRALVEQANSEFTDEMIQIMQSFSDRDYFFALDEMKKILTISKGEQAAEDEIAALRSVVGR